MSSTLVLDAPGPPITRRTWMPAYAIAFQAASTVLLTIRIASRLTKNGTKWGYDDVFIILAFANGVGVTALILLTTYTAGYDRHVWDVPSNLLVRGALIEQFIGVEFLLASCFTKVSILLFYRRVVDGICTRRYKIAVWVALVFCVSYTIAFEVMIWTGCTPVESAWLRFDPTYKADYHCLSNFTQMWTSQLAGGLSVFSDLYALMIPGFLLIQLSVPKRQKIALYFVFGLGISVIAAAIVRTIYLGQVVNGKSNDLTWITFNDMAASIAEIQLGIICACAPSLKSVFRRFFQAKLTHCSSHFSSCSSNSDGIFGKRKASRNSDDMYALSSEMELRLQWSSKKGMPKKRKGCEMLSCNSSFCSLNKETPYSPGGHTWNHSASRFKAALKWPRRRPEIFETTGFAKAPSSNSVPEEWIVETHKAGTSPTPIRYQPSEAPLSVLSLHRAPSAYSFTTFQRWESERDVLSPPPTYSTRPDSNLNPEARYVGRAF